MLQAVTREEQRWAQPEKFVSCIWEKADRDEGDFSASGPSRPLKRHDHSPRSPRTVSVPYRNLPEWYVTSTIVPALERDIPLCDPEQEAEEMIAGPSSSPSCAHNPPSHLLVCNPTSHRKSTPAGRDHFLENGPSRLHSTHHSFLHAIHLQLAHHSPCRTTSRKAAPHPRWLDCVHSAERCPDWHRSWPHCISTVRSHLDPVIFSIRSTVP